MKKILFFSSVLAVCAGIILTLGGVWGIYFTYTNVAREHIVTPKDASLPERPVRGVRTLLAQASVIREHTLKSTDRKTFAEMPRQIAKVDENGNPVLDAQGKQVMVPNAARDMWITATTLITALHLGVLTYAFAGMFILLGLISVWTGIVFFMLYRER